MLRICKSLPLVLILMFSSNIFAYEWFNRAIQSDTPDELHYYIGVSEECSVSLKEARTILEGVFIRSRVKPIEGIPSRKPYLNVNLNCLNVEGISPVFTINIHFAEQTDEAYILFDKSFSYFGIGRKEFILQGMKSKIEDAMTEYIKANFDL